MNRRHSFRALALAACLAGASQAHALAVLDFQDLSCAQTQELCGAGDTYGAKGFTLRYAPAAGEPYPVGFSAVGKLWRFNVNGSIAMEANSCSATTTLSNNKGATFSLLSIDLAEANGDSPSSVSFVAIKADGTRITKVVKLDGKVGWQRVSLPATFTKLKAVTWSQGDCVGNMPSMFDNVLVN